MPAYQATQLLGSSRIHREFVTTSFLLVLAIVVLLFAVYFLVRRASSSPLEALRSRSHPPGSQTKLLGAEVPGSDGADGAV